MVRWPDNPPVRVKRLRDIERGDHCTLTVLSLGVHSGTHMDAPVHFLRKGLGIDSMPLSTTVGPARVIPIRDRKSIKPEELQPYQLRQGERVLFKTRNSPRCWKTDRFLKDFVYLTEEAARYLAERRIRTVGVDYLSVAGYRQDTVATHQALLNAGIWIIEGLNLSRVKTGPCELLCLPMKIAGGDGAPARAYVRPVTNGKKSLRRG
jgi:arylformamidase